MFKGFTDWLDLYIAREEPSSILKSLVGLMAFAGLLGTIFGNQAVRAGAFVVVTLFTVSIILLLLADRRRLKYAYDTQREQLARYCEHIYHDATDPHPHILVESWQQTTYIRANGDTREILRLKAVALRENLRFMRLTVGSKWDQPEKYRRDVKIITRSLAAGGTPGPRWHVTMSWHSTQKLVAISHLREPLKHGEEFTLEMIRSWPAKCQPLMRNGEAEDFILATTNRLRVRDVEYTVVLPAGFDAVHELIGTRAPNVRISAQAQHDQEGRPTFTWRTSSVPAMTKVGFRLELR